MHCFISYATEDQAAAQAIRTTLLQEGHTVFMDREELGAGEGFSQRLREEIERAELVVFLLRPESIETDRFARLELEMVAERWPDASAHLLPVVIRPVDFGSLPPYLRSVTIGEPKGDLGAWTAWQVAEMERARSRMVTRLVRKAWVRRCTVILSILLVLLPCLALISLQLAPPWPEEPLFAGIAAGLVAVAGLGLAHILARRGTRRSLVWFAAVLAAFGVALGVAYLVVLSANTEIVGEYRVLDLGLDPANLRPEVLESLRSIMNPEDCDSLSEAFEVHRWGQPVLPADDEIWRPELVRNVRLLLLFLWLLIYLLLAVGCGLLVMRPGSRAAAPNAG